MALSLNNIFKLRFFDNEVNPESFTLGEIGELFSKLDDSIKSIIENDYPNIDLDNVHLSPVGIENKSESILISLNNSPKEVLEALYSFGDKIQKQTYVNLPDKAYNGFKYIYKLSEKKKCQAEITHGVKNICTINYREPIIRQENVFISIDTTLYGELIKVGGDKSRAWLELTNGNKLSFDISRTDAEQLGHTLYKLIALKGKANWNPQTNFFRSFKLYEILPYKPGGAATAFSELRKITGGFWDTVNDNDQISHILGRDE